MLSAMQQQRYENQIKLDNIGTSGQQRLLNAHVLCIGAGGLAASALTYLAGSGLGRLTVLDDDIIERSNLPRQILFSEFDIGKSKARIAADKLSAQFPDCTIEPFDIRFNSDAASTIGIHFDFILDCTDNLTSRFLVNDFAIRARIPFVYASAQGFRGQYAIFGLPDGPCLRCLFESPEHYFDMPRCADAGVMNVAPGMMGIAQANLAIAYLLNPTRLTSELTTVDLATNRFDTITLSRNPDCTLCTNSLTDHDTLALPQDNCPRDCTSKPSASIKHSNDAS